MLFYPGLWPLRRHLSRALVELGNKARDVWGKSILEASAKTLWWAQAQERPREAERDPTGDARSERMLYTRVRGKSPEGSGPTWPCLVWLSQRLRGGAAMRGQTQHPVRTEGFAATQGRDVAATRGVPGGQTANMFAGTVGGSAGRVGM